MSKYTTEVRFICESLAGKEHSEGYNSVNAIVENAIDKIFTEPVEFFDNAYRPIILKKLLKHYYTREICAETFGLWQLWINNRLSEIMPYYNNLYKSALLEFDPFNEVDLTRSYNKESDGTSAMERNKKERQDKDTTGTKQHTTDFTDKTIDNESYKEDSTSKQILDGESLETRNTLDNRSGTTSVTESGTRSGTTNTDKDTTDAFSDTPQGSLSNISNMTYLTNARIVNENTDSTDHESTQATKTTTENINETGTGTIKNETDNTTDTTENTSGTGSLDRSKTSKEIFNSTATENIDNEKTEKTTQDNTSKNLEEYLEHIVGKKSTKSYSELLNEYRNTFLNIDLMFIREFSDLFMGLW